MCTLTAFQNCKRNPRICTITHTWTFTASQSMAPNPSRSGPGSPGHALPTPQRNKMWLSSSLEGDKPGSGEGWGEVLKVPGALSPRTFLKFWSRMPTVHALGSAAWLLPWLVGAAPLLHFAHHHRPSSTQLGGSAHVSRTLEIHDCLSRALQRPQRPTQSLAAKGTHERVNVRKTE